MIHTLDPTINRLMHSFNEYVKELEAAFNLLKTAYRYGYAIDDSSGTILEANSGGVITWYEKMSKVFTVIKSYHPKYRQ